MSKRRVDYIDKIEFYNLMVERYNDVKRAKANKVDPPPVNPQISRNIVMIANGLASKYSFAKLSYSDELAGYGIEDAIKAVDKFDPRTSENPFSYFTTCIRYAFLRCIREERKQQYLKFKETESRYTSGELIEGDSDSFGGVIDDNDYRDDFIRSFEDDLEKRRRSRDKDLDVGLLNTSIFIYDESEEEYEDCNLN